MLMRPVVVDDEMDGELFGDRGLDVAQELEELLVALAALALGNGRAGGDTARRPVSQVILGTIH